MACPDCNNEKVDCGCIKEALHISQVCNPVDCSTEECTESFAAGCIVYTGDDILCGTTVLVTSGESIAQALANTIAYFCTTDGIENDILCGEDVVVSAPATINEGLEQVAAYFCTQIDNLNIQIGDINNLITIIQGDITSLQGDVTTINNTISQIQGDLINNAIITFTDSVDLDGCTIRSYAINLEAIAGTIASINFDTPPICPPIDICDQSQVINLQTGDTLLLCRGGNSFAVSWDNLKLFLGREVLGPRMLASYVDQTGAGIPGVAGSVTPLSELATETYLRSDGDEYEVDLYLEYLENDPVDLVISIGSGGQWTRTIIDSENCKIFLNIKIARIDQNNQMWTITETRETATNTRLISEIEVVYTTKDLNVLEAFFVRLTNPGAAVVNALVLHKATLNLNRQLI